MRLVFIFILSKSIKYIKSIFKFTIFLFLAVHNIHNVNFHG
ncbi:hypothetical protein HMPREF0693_0577 [Proteus mirabilis ATCC 29906]|nr:hypothetical protein HMPREF0693_0577 [Proteus mirabilis ATCC 29906]